MRRLILSWLFVFVVLAAGIIPEAMAAKTKVPASTGTNASQKHKKLSVKKHVSKKNSTKDQSQTSTR